MQYELPNMKALTTCSFAEINYEKIQLKQTLKYVCFKIMFALKLL